MRKKKKKFGYYLYAVVMMILTILNITIATFLLTYVQKIKVTGTKFSTDSQIISLVKEDPFTANSIYAVVKGMIGSYQIPQYLESMKVSFDMPWGLEVKVEEKQVVAGVLTNNAYVYFSEDGTILSKGAEVLDGVVAVEGAQTKKLVLYEPVQFKNDKLLSYIISVSEEIRKNELSPERVVWEDESMNLYFGGICVRLGKMNYDEKIVQVPPILEKLEGKEGVLHLEHYNEMSTSISFDEN